MATGTREPGQFEYMDELLRDLGGIPPSRVRLNPTPGTATIRDLIRLQKKDGRIYELVDGTLVAKPVAFTESGIAINITLPLGNYVVANDLGVVTGEQGLMKLMPGLARGPDVSFVSWAQLPERQFPREPVPGLYPDLAVEVLSKGNTKREMARKRREYFLAGTRLVWQVSPRKRTVDVYTAPDQFTTFTEGDTLDGGGVLPGFTLPVRDIFANVPRTPRKRKDKRR
ncbi:MAG TPA: Uma2 family endonuclease [Gemmataceae bacterium]|nr:Uma2 family endonuclease [Gemmataceae bacterium]